MVSCKECEFYNIHTYKENGTHYCHESPPVHIGSGPFAFPDIFEQFLNIGCGKGKKRKVRSDWEGFGKDIKRVRGDRGIREAAKEIGIGSATLSRIERGSIPTIINYNKLVCWYEQQREKAKQ